MEIILVAAVAENNALGKDNAMIWHLPDDFKHFKSLTTGHFILMGRKTFESFPKPLPNRTHLIISRNTNYQVPENCFVFQSIDEAIKFTQDKNQDKLFVIGGGQIYIQTIDLATELSITEVHELFNADTYFPAINKNVWKSVEVVHHETDEKHKYAFDIITYKRNNE
ncbi:dihydrofolate reductase [Paenimyroides tangerinum]|uniref:Dihydrofolate reductase n=1 Tax=Paenimyroides tangerinum TaxID=2488728 RepID=A0A3P3W7E7_9FLAO|nr:dihydrofolate reductase [Paenimyroides tangerinum]RRJ89886.1 dihydrofolate reductase [Paenimyroides tangerinum]